MTQPVYNHEAYEIARNMRDLDPRLPQPKLEDFLESPTEAAPAVTAASSLVEMQEHLGITRLRDR